MADVSCWPRRSPTACSPASSFHVPPRFTAGTSTGRWSRMSELSPLMTARSMSRRGVLKAGVTAGLAGMLLPALAGCSPEDPVDSLTVAGGEPGGFYLEFATLLAASLQRNGVARQATALETGGSLDNLEHLLGGRATFAVALADAAA